MPTIHCLSNLRPLQFVGGELKGGLLLSTAHSRDRRPTRPADSKHSANRGNSRPFDSFFLHPPSSSSLPAIGFANMFSISAFIISSVLLFHGVGAQQPSATYTPDTAPPTTQEGQQGTNKCGTSASQTSMCQNAQSMYTYLTRAGCQNFSG